MSIVSGSDAEVANVIEKKRREIEQVLSEEKKHIKNQFEDNLNKNLLNKSREQFKELEALMRKEEDFLKKKLTDLFDNNECFARNVELDSSVAKNLKIEIMSEISALEKRVLISEKGVIDEIRASVQEDITLMLTKMENAVNIRIDDILSDVSRHLHDKKSKEVIENSKPVLSESYQPDAEIKKQIKEDKVKTSISNLKKKMALSDESPYAISIKDLYEKSARKVPFWGSKSSNVVGSYSLKSKDKCASKDKIKDLYKNCISSNLMIKKFLSK